MGNRQTQTKLNKVIMSTNDYGYRLLDAEELGETTEEETTGVTAEKETEEEEKEEEVTL